MPMFSAFFNFRIIDEKAHNARLLDMAIALTDNDYPPVTHLIFYNSKKERVRLAWTAVKSINFDNNRIEVRDLEAAEPEPEDIASEVLLRRDVLDALIINLQRLHASRANDLWLEEENGGLALKAADTSAGAVLRRLSRGWLAGNPDQLRYDWKYIEFLRGDPLSVKSKGNYQMRIGLLPPGQIAGLSHSLPYLHAAELLTLLPDHIAADTLELLPIERQIQVFGVLEEKQAERILARMAPNAAADLLGRQTPQVMKNYLERLPQEQTERLIELLRYPEDTVGGIMTNDFVSIPLDITVREAREMLHERLKFPDFTYFIYVIDSDDTRILRGVTTLREIMTAEADQQLEDIVNTHVSTLNPLESAVAAAYRVLDTHTAALPVTGGEGQLLGIVTVDAAVDQAAPQGWRAQAPKVFS